MLAEKLRKVAIQRLFETKSFESAWKTWRPLISKHFDKKIYDDQIKDIPSANELQGSTHKIDKELKKNFLLR